MSYGKVFNGESCRCAVINKGDGEIVINGVTNSGKKVVYWAAAPPTRGYSFSGSSLPYPNTQSAYDNTCNKGAVYVNDGKFSFKIKQPNSYYNENWELVKPHVNIKVCNENDDGETTVISVSDSIPYRSLDHPTERTSVNFYSDYSHISNRVPCVRGQNQILLSSAYGLKRNTFWGDMPPH